MSSIFTIDSASKSQNIDSNAKLQTYKRISLFISIEIKVKDQKETQKPIAKNLGISDSAIKRYRSHIVLDSFYKRNKTKENSQRPTLTHSNLKAGKSKDNSKKKQDVFWFIWWSLQKYLNVETHENKKIKKRTQKELELLVVRNSNESWKNQIGQKTLFFYKTTDKNMKKQ